MRELWLFLALVSACSFSPAASRPQQLPDAAPSPPSADAGASQPAADAPPGGTACLQLPGLALYNGHHYFATVAPGTWQHDEQACAAPGGHLVKIDDAGENAFVLSTFHPTSYVWIGLTESDGSFAWTDGTAPGYTNFSAQSDTSDSSCVDFDHTGSWSPYDCAQPHVGICECE